ncbi:MAG TPA: hypothetical protein VK668_21205 [Mucilaginibacter sp.]|nr:hypothetical protein [Mucilaginibacter sp.]
MKNMITFLLILFSVSAFAQNHTQKDLLGHWEGSDSAGTPAAVTFSDSAKVVVAIQGVALPPYTCKSDFTKTPATIDLAVIALNGKEAILPGFMLFVDDNTIKWWIFPNGNRPATFDENSNSPVITLKRVKK